MHKATGETSKRVIESALKGSGFPFQTAVRHEIATHKERYRIHASEYPWRNGRNQDGFLDLVAVSSQLVLTIECKKTKQEQYIFLLPLGTGSSSGDVQDFRCINVTYFNSAHTIAQIICQTRLVDPSSPSCEFCILTSDNKGRMLERDAAILVSATDAFACDNQEWPKLTVTPPFPIIPVLVTNAELYVARYKPQEVSLQSGEFTKIPSEVERAPWIRFYKTFVAGQGRDLGLRTIFIVNASSLAEFLNHLDQAIGQASNAAPVKLL